MAAATASILLLVLTSICSKIVPAFWLSQAGTNCAGPRLRTPFAYSGFRILSTPPLNRNEFASSWPPHSEATTGCEPYLPAFLRPLTTPWPWSRPTCGTIERRVQDGRAALDLAVVVDRLDALRKGCPLDRGRGAGVDRGDDQHLGAVGDALIRLRLLLLRVALGVDDAGRDMGGLEGLLQVRPVELLPADRRLRVGHQAARLDAGALRRRSPPVATTAATAATSPTAITFRETASRAFLPL